ncbi:hypothetical protein EJB05_26466, partial [Eragrostis curvula]
MDMGRCPLTSSNSTSSCVSAPFTASLREPTTWSSVGDLCDIGQGHLQHAATTIFDEGPVFDEEPVVDVVLMASGANINSGIDFTLSDEPDAVTTMSGQNSMATFNGRDVDAVLAHDQLLKSTQDSSILQAATQEHSGQFSSTGSYSRALRTVHFYRQFTLSVVSAFYTKKLMCNLSMVDRITPVFIHLKGGPELFCLEKQRTKLADSLLRGGEVPCGMQAMNPRFSEVFTYRCEQVWCIITHWREAGYPRELDCHVSYLANTIL